jgi:hypothetical protein
LTDYIFGSTPNGRSENEKISAGDSVFLVIDGRECDGIVKKKGRKLLHITIDKEAHRRFGIRVARDNRDVFLKWLTKGMRGVSRHCRDMDGVVLDVQTLIYPRYDLEPTA